MRSTAAILPAATRTAGRFGGRIGTKTARRRHLRVRRNRVPSTAREVGSSPTLGWGHGLSAARAGGSAMAEVMRGRKRAEDVRVVGAAPCQRAERLELTHEHVAVPPQLLE